MEESLAVLVSNDKDQDKVSVSVRAPMGESFTTLVPNDKDQDQESFF